MLKITRVDAEEKVAQYRTDAEVAQDRLKVSIEYVSGSPKVGS